VVDKWIPPRDRDRLFWQPEWRDIDRLAHAPQGTWQDVKMNIFVSLVKITSIIIAIIFFSWFTSHF